VYRWVTLPAAIETDPKLYDGAIDESVPGPARSPVVAACASPGWPRFDCEL
jgi:hypothetical protein